MDKTTRRRAAAHYPTAARVPSDTPPPADWAADAEDAVLQLAAVPVPFGPDDVRALGVAEPDHPNRWGSVFSGLHRAGYIHPVAFVASARRARHRGLQRLWVGTSPDPDAVALVEDRRRAVRARLDALGAVADVATLPVLAAVMAGLEDLDEGLGSLGVGRHA